MKITPCLMIIFAVAALFVFHGQAEMLDGTLGGVLDATYTIEKREISLIDGRAEVQAVPGSAAKIITAIFGKPVYGDGLDDAALFLVQDPGGSGTFYYVAASIAKNGIYQGTNAVFLGDRIDPLTIHIRNGVIVADYADRRLNQSMASPPSIGKSICLTVKEGRLEAVKNPW